MEKEGGHPRLVFVLAMTIMNTMAAGDISSFTVEEDC